MSFFKLSRKNQDFRKQKLNIIIHYNQLINERSNLSVNLLPTKNSWNIHCETMSNLIIAKMKDNKKKTAKFSFFVLITRYVKKSCAPIATKQPPRKKMVFLLKKTNFSSLFLCASLKKKLLFTKLRWRRKQRSLILVPF